MHVLLCIVTGRYSSRLYIAYLPLVSAHAQMVIVTVARIGIHVWSHFLVRCYLQFLYTEKVVWLTDPAYLFMIGL